MNVLKSIARNVLFPLITATGAEKLISAVSSNKQLIIMFHGVIPDPDYKISPNHLSLHSFERIIEYLVKNFQIVTLTEIRESKNNNQGSEKKQIAITFDDGYENNYKYAFPILKKHKVPATIFTITAGINESDYYLWYDLVDIVKNEIDFSLINHLLSSLQPGITANNGNELKSVMKLLSTESKKVILDHLKSTYFNKLKQIQPDYYRILNSNQIREMSESGLIEIGSHTVNHPNLDVIHLSSIKQEVTESKTTLENITGGKVNSIAFPDGAYNKNVKNESLAAGYKNLVAVDYRLPEDVSDNNIVSRFCISNTTTSASNLISMHLAFNKSGF